MTAHCKIAASSVALSFRSFQRTSIVRLRCHLSVFFLYPPRLSLIDEFICCNPVLQKLMVFSCFILDSAESIIPRAPVPLCMVSKHNLTFSVFLLIAPWAIFFFVRASVCPQCLASLYDCKSDESIDGH